MTPTIQTTLGALVTAEPALTRLSEITLPVSTAYQVAKLLRAVRVETQHFTEQRDTFIRTHGEERDATEAEQATGAIRVMAVRPEYQVEFITRMNDLAALVVDLDVRPIALDTLGPIEWTAADLLALGPLVVDGMPEIAI